MRPNDLAALIGGGSCLLFSLILVGVVFLPLVFYCLTMQKALRLAGPNHREMEPGMVWLLFIPLFGLVWHFFVVRNVSNAVMRWAAQNGQEVGDGGWSLGLTACILFCCGIIPLLGVLASLAGLIIWIIWWVKVADFNARMARVQ